MRNLEDNTLLLLTVAVSLAFALILWPFYEAVLWATVLASCSRRSIGGFRVPWGSGNATRLS